ncbi:MAG: hypothetical protein ACR2H1_01625 [Limisphaerales bacterium]
MFLKKFIFFLLLLLAGLASGVLLERRILSKTEKSAGPLSNASAAKQFQRKISPRKILKTNDSAAAEISEKKLSWKEVTPALQAALAETNFHKRREALNRLAEEIQDEDVPKIFPLIDTIPAGGVRNDFLKRILARWAETDPIAAMKKAQAERIGENDVLQVWAEHDLAGATAWWKQLPPGQIRNQTMHLLISLWAKDNPQNALALIETLPPGQNKQQL